MKFGLGTAQFGQDYGLTNKNGKVPPDEVFQILEEAEKAGVSTIDTATHYGESETVLGASLKPGHRFEIVTKTPQFGKRTISRGDAEQLTANFHRSLENLKQGSIYGLLVHSAGDLLAENGDWLFEALSTLKQEKLVQKIGISVYTREEADRVLSRFQADLIQLPLNVLNQQFAQKGYLKRLKERGIEIHARSIFLQGLLLAPPEELDDYFQPVKRHLEEYHAALKVAGLTPVEGAIKFIAEQRDVDGFIIGVCSLDQFRAVAGAFRSSRKVSDFNYENFALDDEKMMNPAFWDVQKN